MSIRDYLTEDGVNYSSNLSQITKQLRDLAKSVDWLGTEINKEIEGGTSKYSGKDDIVGLYWELAKSIMKVADEAEEVSKSSLKLSKVLYATLNKRQAAKNLPGGYQ